MILIFNLVLYKKYHNIYIYHLDFIINFYTYNFITYIYLNICISIHNCSIYTYEYYNLIMYRIFITIYNYIYCEKKGIFFPISYFLFPVLKFFIHSENCITFHITK